MKGICNINDNPNIYNKNHLDVQKAKAGETNNGTKNKDSMLNIVELSDNNKENFTSEYKDEKNYYK